MQGVGPGTVLGGRYTVSRRLEQRDGAERWHGHDATLLRDVTLLVVPQTHPQVDAILDAARRSAGVDNSQLVRVLDAGSGEGCAFVVEEDLSSAQPLSLLAARGGLPAEEVRRIVGVTSRALEGARLRGLHHEALSPDSILRTPDGTVKVVGLGTAAALLGREGTDPESASRADAVAVVALAYAGLTGHWPLATASGGLPPAPRFVGGVAAPSEIAAGVPHDLDALCRLTLNEDQGPSTPGDFARQIAPWSHEPVGDFGGGDSEDGADPKTSPAGADTSPTQVVSLDRTGDAVPDGSGSQGWKPGAWMPPGPVSAGPVSAGPVSAGPVPDGSAPDALVRAGDAPADDASSSAAALGSAAAVASSAVGAFSGRVGGLARNAADRVKSRAADRRAAKAAAAEWTEEHRVPLTETLEPQTAQPGESTNPLLAPDNIEPLSRDESKLALGIVAGLLALALIIGVWGVSRMGSSLGLGSDGRSTSLVTGAPSTGGATSGATTAATGTATTGATLEDLAVLSARSFDPLGDNRENDAAVGRIYDGKTSTVWTSEGYISAALGGIKPGVGVILDVGANATAKQVTVTQPTGSDFTIYLNRDRSLDGATTVGASTGRTGSIDFTVPATAKGQYLIVWFTKLARGDGGRFRASLAEVAVKG